MAPSLKRRFQKLFGPMVEVIWISCSGLEDITGNLAWLEDVIFDMAIRARSAMPYGGRLVIEWANIHVDEVNHASQDLEPGRYVMLEMTCLRQNPSDLIAGEPSSHWSELRDAWMHSDFSQAHMRIRTHGGQICEYNEPGRALTIRAFFPSEQNTSAIRNFPMDERLKRMRILLVEDEGFVRDVALGILQSEGYEVLTAQTGQEALQIIEKHGPVHLLVTDVVMPGMNGLELALHLTTLHPELKTIYMSGYSEGLPVVSNCLESNSSFLQKPFTVEGLTEKVKQVLAEPVLS